jgi:hypothetical protein
MSRIFLNYDSTAMETGVGGPRLAARDSESREKALCSRESREELPGYLGRGKNHAEERL